MQTPKGLKNYNMVTSKLKYYRITSKVQKELIKFTFNECKHEANVKAASIRFSHNGVSLVVNNLTFNDLKKLRRTIRKLIKGMEYGKV